MTIPAPVPVSPSEITALINEVDAVVEDALKGGSALQADIGTLLISGAGVAAELGWISSQTDGIIAAVATVVLASIFRIIALARHGQKAKVKAAAYHAVGLAALGQTQVSVDFPTTDAQEIANPAPALDEQAPVGA